MKSKFANIESIDQQISSIITKARELEEKYAEDISKVNPVFTKSAQNLVHYLAFRSFDVDIMQAKLRKVGLPSLSNIEGHVMESLLSIKTIINHLQGKQVIENARGVISLSQAKKIMDENTQMLFGAQSRLRRTRIMVTLPDTSAEEPKEIERMLKAGMNSARINCAHDSKDDWKKMIANLDIAKSKLDRDCKVMMDLAGPKLRTGPIGHGPKIVLIEPDRNMLGEMVHVARIWIAPPGILPPPADLESSTVLPIDAQLFRKIKRGTTILFSDANGKKCNITVERKEGPGKWAWCKDSARITPGTKMELHRKKKSGKETVFFGEMLPAEQFLLLNSGDILVLTKDNIPGENAVYSTTGKLIKHPSISCTLPGIFKYLKTGESIFFDDGKIEGKLIDVGSESLKVKIIHTKDKGSKLREDKGINLPDSDLPIKGLTEKDQQDMKFVVKHADTVNFSFVNSSNDVKELLNLIEELKGNIGVILKIETKKGFKNLPEILLKAMRTYPIGVMIARGDLAIETGWNNFATIQEEILRICGAAHVPDIWATQVLENMAKKGIPSRAEITDASVAQRAECVMLNKGYYIEKTIKLLDKILIKMQRYKNKKETVLPRLVEAENLKLEYS